MKVHLYVLYLFLTIAFTIPSLAQPLTDSEGDVGIGTLTPDPSAILDVTSTSKGFLMPRMTSVQRDAISSPANGLMVYNTELGVPQIWSDASGSFQWDELLTTGSNLGWLTHGNAGLVDGTDNFFGTLDGTDIRFITNDTERMRLTADGGFGIGTTTPLPYVLIDVAGEINTSESYDIDGTRWLWDGPGGINNTFVGAISNTTNNGVANVFVGAGAGESNTSGGANVFVGAVAGLENTGGVSNTFVGASAGESNTEGEGNTFIGQASGANNTNGDENVMIGSLAGTENDTGYGNVYIGNQAGFRAIADMNTFVGHIAGINTTTGETNTFVGQNAGESNTTGGGNTLLGQNADVGSESLANATAIGANAEVAQDNSLVLGSINGVNGAAADVNVGIGTTAPQQRFHVEGTAGTPNVRLGSLSGSGNVASLGEGEGFVIADVNGDLDKRNPGTVIDGLAWRLGGNSAPLTSNILGTLSSGGLVDIRTNNITVMRLDNTASSTVDVVGSVNTDESYNIDGNIWLWDGPGGINNTFVGPTFNTANEGVANVFVGVGAGSANVFGGGNVFVGVDAGGVNTDGGGNTFVGLAAGAGNTTGENNTFIGQGVGQNTLTGDENVMVGSFSGLLNETGEANVYLGKDAGRSTITSSNTFIGHSAGMSTTTGGTNTFVGQNAGASNTTGVANTLIGQNADVGLEGLTNATAVGAGAVVSQDNALVLGNNADVGIGISTPSAQLDLVQTGTEPVLETTGGSVLFDGTTGDVPASGAGTRFMWIPSESALRAGYVSGTQWDAANIGEYSVGLGYQAEASGQYSISLAGVATAQEAIAIGFATASGTSSVAIGGNNTTASGFIATSIGSANVAAGDYSIALGNNLTLDADADRSFGFLANSGSNAMTISDPDVAVFGNANLWLANNNNAASELRFYGPESTTGAFPSSASYSAFKAGSQEGDLTYILPVDFPNEDDVLIVQSIAGSTVQLAWQSLESLAPSSEDDNVPTSIAPSGKGNVDLDARVRELERALQLKGEQIDQLQQKVNGLDQLRNELQQLRQNLSGQKLGSEDQFSQQN